MRTLDVTKLGIDRNFLRSCETHGLIAPQRIDSDWIINKNYMRRDYSQKELEIVWNAYLYRKMGLSFEQIKALNNGEKVYTRASLANLIQKYENQIEELQAIVEFMKYVKGVGFVPSPPDILMRSTDFKSYLIDFINHLDKDRKIKKFFEFVEQVSDISDFEKMSDDDLGEIETIMGEVTLNVDEVEIENHGKMLLSLKEKTHLNPISDEVQEIILYMYNYQKKANNDNDLSAWDFAMNQIYVFSFDSDFSNFYKTILGEDAFKFLKKALVAFLKNQEPDKFREYINNLQTD